MKEGEDEEGENNEHHQQQLLHSLCNQILASDNSIRFVGVPNNMGKLVVSKYRNDIVTPILSEQEIEMLAIEAVLRMKTRKDFESKLGKPVYSFTLYEKVKRATITLEKDNERYPILMVSFDVQAEHDSIIINKILPIVRKQQ
ncbi:MAG: hypothetical protein JO297_19010 [Nitrososphaeraceae archaeon]|nr:hypothetical protein [Nitrososphaeraceae archaeon]